MDDRMATWSTANQRYLAAAATLARALLARAAAPGDAAAAQVDAAATDLHV